MQAHIKILCNLTNTILSIVFAVGLCKFKTYMVIQGSIP